MSANAVATEVAQIVTDLAAYQKMASDLGSHEAALAIHLKRAGLSRQPRKFVRDFCAVDVGQGKHPTVICYVPSGAWAQFRSGFKTVVEELETRPDKDDHLIKIIEFLDLYRRDPSHPFLRAERP
ncbi:MAG: hypothetical protein JOY92_04630 [Verrucomicrobia bacterium]|nr:hypothetical protein [Verrucomicrobiota bacterium]